MRENRKREWDEGERKGGRRVQGEREKLCEIKGKNKKLIED